MGRQAALTKLIDVTHGFTFDGKYFVDWRTSNCPILLIAGVNFTDSGFIDLIKEY